MNNDNDAGVSRGHGRRGRPPSANAMTDIQRQHRHRRMQQSTENRDAVREADTRARRLARNSMPIEMQVELQAGDTEAH